MTTVSCPGCASPNMVGFYRASALPVHTTLLMPTRQHALDYPTRDLQLGYCDNCGFIANTLFERGIHEYSPQCEESQGHSPVFKGWLEDLARQLIDKFDIRNRTVLEIGSGKGEFISAMCRLGDNAGIAYDPAYVTGRLPTDETLRLDFRSRLWDRDCTVHDADWVICRHTLEHIADVSGFLQDILSAIGDRRDTLLFFEVPDTLRILQEGAFWDIYYEHCSYFSQASLTRLFQSVGFDVLESWLDYDDQYILLIARPASETIPANELNRLPSVSAAVDIFSRKYQRVFNHWTRFLENCAAQQLKVMLWGGGSKAAAFLNLVDVTGVIEQVIDINPNKHHAYIPGTGQEVIGPDSLADNPADVIIAMNSIYLDEIQAQLDAMNCKSRLLAV